MWVAREICTKCKKQLTSREVAYSDGCCPYCGHLSGNTFCAVEKFAVELPPPPSWYLRWSMYRAVIWFGAVALGFCAALKILLGI